MPPRIDAGVLRLLAEVAGAASLSGAALRLGLSQPAVSQRLREVERRLGVALFQRGPRGVRPTEAGEALLREILPALTAIDRAVEVVTARRPAFLRLRCDFAFAGLWLLPRLAGFRAAHPGAEVEITAAQDVPPPGPGEVAIRFATEAQVGPGARLLMPERVVPVAASGLSAPSLAEAALLHLEARPGAAWMGWDDWFGPGKRPRRAGDLTLNTHDLVLQAAEAGQGVALAWLPLVAGRLARGRLVALAPERLRPDRGYWIETGDPASPLAGALEDWLLTAAAQSAAMSELPSEAAFTD